MRSVNLSKSCQAWGYDHYHEQKAVNMCKSPGIGLSDMCVQKNFALWKEELAGGGNGAHCWGRDPHEDELSLLPRLLLFLFSATAAICNSSNKRQGIDIPSGGLGEVDDDSWLNVNFSGGFKGAWCWARDADEAEFSLFLLRLLASVLEGVFLRYISILSPPSLLVFKDFSPHLKKLGILGLRFLGFAASSEVAAPSLQ